MFFSKDNTAKVASLFTDLLARLDRIVDRETEAAAEYRYLLTVAETERTQAMNLRAKISDLVS